MGVADAMHGGLACGGAEFSVKFAFHEIQCLTNGAIKIGAEGLAQIDDVHGICQC